MKFFHGMSIKASLLSLAYLLYIGSADAVSVRDGYRSSRTPLLVHNLPSEQKSPTVADLSQLQVPDSIRRQIPRIQLDPRLIDTLRRRGSGLNQPQFVAINITPDTPSSSELPPTVISRKDKESPRELEQKVFTVFFGPQGGRPPTDPAEQIDCSRLAMKSPRDEDLQTVFRVETSRSVTGGTARTQLMYMEEGVTSTNPNYRGTLICNELRNSLSFKIPGRLLGGGNVTVHAIAYSKTGLVAYQQFKYKVENPDIIVRLTKVRNNSRKDDWDGLGIRKEPSRPDIYIMTQAILNTGRSAIDRERGLAVFGPPQLGTWGNVPPGDERRPRPENTTIYNGEVGLGVELGINAYDHDDYNLALINAQLWQASSAIYCQIEQYCPDAVPQATAPLHRLMQNAIRRAGNDDFMAGTEIKLRPDSDRSASPFVGRNWGLDPTSALRPGVDGYEINMGNVSVWLTFQEADPSWLGLDLI